MEQHPTTPPSAIEHKRASQSPEAIAERQRLFLAACEHHSSPSKAAQALGISPSNITYWKKNDKEFAEKLADVRKAKQFQLEDLLWQLASGERTKDNIPHFQAIDRLLKTYAPEDWREQVDHKHTGVVFHTAIPSPVRPEDIEMIEDADYQMLEES